MASKWKTKEPYMTNKEGFAIFDDSYFKDCVDLLSQGSLGKSILNNIREIFEYLTCPIFRFDTLVDDIIYEFIKNTNRIPCPDVSDTRQSNTSKNIELTNSNVNRTTLSDINRIIDNHKWVSNKNIANIVLYTYLYCLQSQQQLIQIDGIDIDIPFLYNEIPESFTPDQLDSFNDNFDTALTSNVIISKIIALSNNADIDSIQILSYGVGQIKDIKSILYQLNDYKTGRTSIISLIIFNIQNQINEQSNDTNDPSYTVTLSISDYNGQDNETIIPMVNQIISNHKDWIVNKEIAENILHYFLNSKNHEKIQVGSPEFITFANEFNSSLYNQNIINMFLTINTNLHTLNDDNEEDANTDKIISHICTNLKSEDIKSNATLIKSEIYNFLQIPIVLFITYNFYYTFFFNNIYNNPEVYLKNIRTDFYDAMGFNVDREDEIEKSKIGYFINLATKPFQFFYAFLKSLYNSGHGDYKNKMWIFFALYIVNFIGLGIGGGYIFRFMKGLILGSDGKIANNVLYGIIYSIAYLIIMFYFVKWAINYFFTPSYIPFSLLFNIFTKFISILIRFIVATISIEIATLICFFYILFYLIGGMKYASIRGNVVDSIKEVNKTLIDEKEKPEEKPFIFLYNSIIEITCLVIIIIYVSRECVKIDVSDPVQYWFLIINIILFLIFSLFIFKAYKNIYYPSV